MTNKLKIIVLITISILLFSACGNKQAVILPDDNNEEEVAELFESEQDEEQIQTLIRQALRWGSESEIALPNPVTKEGGVWNGLNMKEHKQNLSKLRESGFFSREFIANYNNLITTLNSKLEDGTIKWECGEMQPFAFAQDHDAWIAAQDLPYYDPDPFEIIEIQVIRLDSERGEFFWKWAGINGMGQSKKSALEDGKQRFDVVKEDGKWKISYLQGFDYEDGISVQNKHRKERRKSNVLDENDVRKLGERFIRTFKTGNLDDLTKYFAPAYLAEVGENYYGGERQKIFYLEFLGGNWADKDRIQPKKLEDIKIIQVINPHIDANRGVAVAQFLITLKSGKDYTVDLYMVVENGKLYFEGGRG